MKLLFSFLLAVVLGLMLFVGPVSLPAAVAAVIVINVVTLLVSPWVNDLIYHWLYGRVGLAGFQDETGLMYQIRQLGNFLFSVRQVPGLIGDQVTVDGWFFLGSYIGAAIAVSLGGGVLALPYIL